VNNDKTVTTSIESRRNEGATQIARLVPVPPVIDTVTVSQDVRVVVTKRNSGVVHLRYAPQDPPTESPNTSS